MLSHPVHFRVVFPEQMNRIHVIIRLVLLAAIGAAGCSSLYWLLFLGLPALAALFIVQKGAPRYLEEDAPRVFFTVPRRRRAARRARTQVAGRCIRVPLAAH